MIEGVKVRFLKPIVDERGRLMEMLKADWPEFSHFGQVYMTTAYPGVVNALHNHKEQTDNFVCVQGMIKLVLYDGRKSSKTFKAVNEFCMGIHHAILVQIPPLVYHGFKCISEQECLLINVPTHPYRYEDPDEYRLEAHTPKIPYNWERKDG
ncbi:MAG: dTDP-4-dehydrorhamnose 3,5-epimerase family protein [Elusimicrobia bacterium]|nr:dTDP-4-dehydrorhamnose 3,5-epimerase family protein [Elusimicrobiota bacterium]